MEVSLFSQSLFALPLDEAIAAAAKAGFPAIELACTAPHFDLDTAQRDADAVAERIQQAGLEVAALSLSNTFTDDDRIESEIESAETFIRLAPLFHTSLIKLTPGPPASADAQAGHWAWLAHAIDALAATAAQVEVRLAFETHMRQLTDTIESARLLLELAESDRVGLTVDLSNLVFASEDLPACVEALKDRTYHVHVKNGFIDDAGEWRFGPLDEGWTDYADVLPRLRDTGYDGYLSIECLGPDAAQRPIETARRDLALLKRLLANAGWETGK